MNDLANFHFDLWRLNEKYNDLKNDIRNHANDSNDNNTNDNGQFSVLPALSDILPDQFPRLTLEQKKAQLLVWEKEIAQSASVIWENWKESEKNGDFATIATMEPTINNPLTSAIFTEDIALLKNMWAAIDTYNAHNTHDQFRLTDEVRREMIDNAIMTHNAELLAFLVEDMGFRVDYVGDESLIGHLSSAITSGNASTIEYLVNHGTPIHANNYGALMHALRMCDAGAFIAMYELTEKREAQKVKDYASGKYSFHTASGGSWQSLPVQINKGSAGDIANNKDAENNIQDNIVANDKGNHAGMDITAQFYFYSSSPSPSSSALGSSFDSSSKSEATKKPVFNNPVHQIYLPLTINQLINAQELGGVLRDWMQKEIEYYGYIRQWQEFNYKTECYNKSNSESNNNDNKIWESEEIMLKEKKALKHPEVIQRIHDDLNNMYAIAQYLVQKGYRVDGEVVFSMMYEHNRQEQFFTQEKTLNQSKDINIHANANTNANTAAEMNTLEIASGSELFESEKVLYLMMQALIAQGNEQSLLSKLLTFQNATTVLNQLHVVTEMGVGYHTIEKFYHENHENWLMQSQAATGSRPKVVLPEKNPASLAFLRFILDNNPEFDEASNFEQKMNIDRRNHKSGKI